MSFGVGSYVTITFGTNGTFGTIGPIQTVRHVCASEGCRFEVVALEDGRYYCAQCLLGVRRKKAIANASQWISGAFICCSTYAQRQDMYRAMAKVFHPDVPGRDPEECHAIMVVLNDFKDKMKL